MRFRPVVVATAVLLALAGCTPAALYGTDSPAPSTTPVFASDADALKAAEAAYAAYLKVSDEVGHDGWKDTTPLTTVASGAALAKDRQTAKEFSSRGLKQVGDTSFDSTKLESIAGSARTATVTVYLCIDVSSVDVTDPSGASIVPGDRKSRVPLEVDVEYRPGASKVSRNDVWSGTDFC